MDIGWRTAWLTAIVVGLVTVNSDLCAGTFTRLDNAAWAASDSDAVNGRIAQEVSGYTAGGTPFLYFSDGGSAHVYLASGSSIVWELGAPCPTRYLTGVDVWCGGTVSGQRDYDWTIQVSSDGSTWTPVAASGAVSPGNYSYNLARFTFAAPSETMGVRYVRLDSAAASYPRVAEVDVFAAGDTVTFSSTDTALDESDADALNGKTPVAVGASGWVGDTANLTDGGVGTPASIYAQPDKLQHLSPASGYAVWALDSADPYPQYLDHVDLWLSRTNTYSTALRKEHRFEVAVSANNVDWTTVATAGTITSSADAYRVTFTFPKEAIIDFSYIRLLSWGARDRGVKTGLGGLDDYPFDHGGIYECDVFLAKIPPKGAIFLVR